jgi:formate hydrogenlyase subunit 4
MMIAALAEPAMLMVTFIMAAMVHSTSLPNIALYFITHAISLRVSVVLAFISMLLVSIAENARIPIDNPATHLELTMVHEAMVLEYSGRHLAMIEMAAMVKMLLYFSLIGCIFVPWGMAIDTDNNAELLMGLVTYVAKLAVGGIALAVFETGIAKMRVFRVPEFLGSALLLGMLGVVFIYVSQGL